MNSYNNKNHNNNMENNNNNNYYFYNKAALIYSGFNLIVISLVYFFFFFFGRGLGQGYGDPHDARRGGIGKNLSIWYVHASNQLFNDIEKLLGFMCYSLVWNFVWNKML